MLSFPISSPLLCGTSWVVGILIIEIQDTLQHLLCLHSRRLGVELYCLHVAVERMLPIASLPVGVALLIPLGSRHHTL